MQGKNDLLLWHSERVASEGIDLAQTGEEIEISISILRFESKEVEIFLFLYIETVFIQTIIVICNKFANPFKDTLHFERRDHCNILDAWTYNLKKRDFDGNRERVVIAIVKLYKL